MGFYLTVAAHLPSYFIFMTTSPNSSWGNGKHLLIVVLTKRNVFPTSYSFLMFIGRHVLCLRSRRICSNVWQKIEKETSSTHQHSLCVCEFDLRHCQFLSTLGLLSSRKFFSSTLSCHLEGALTRCHAAMYTSSKLAQMPTTHFLSLVCRACVANPQSLSAAILTPLIARINETEEILMEETRFCVVEQVTLD